MTLADRIEAKARALGFDLVGIVPVRPMVTADHYQVWLQKGYHGEMAYLARPEAVEKRCDLSRILPGVRSVVAVGINYHTASLPAELSKDHSRGVIASYAWGDDYHDLLTSRLRELAAFVESETGRVGICPDGSTGSPRRLVKGGYRVYADTGPVLEREIASHADLGFVGKNTNLIHPRLGSWLLLGELLLTVEILSSQSEHQGACGRCTRCLDACPTSAFVAPYILDARRCISYLTIELKGPIPHQLRPLMGNHIFGCDICQQVCPWNRRFARPTREPAFQPRPDAMAPSLLDLIALDDEGFRQRFRGSPVKRTKRRGLLRNVAVALGNWGDPVAVPLLTRALGDAEPLIREHAAWALGRTATSDAQRALTQALSSERDGRVRKEIMLALGQV